MTNDADEASNRAVLWLIRQGQPDWSDEHQREFDAWLAASMLNRAVYLRQREGWRAADRLASLGTASFAAMAPPQSPWSRRIAPLAAAACLALAALGAVTGARLQTPELAATTPRQIFATAVGAQDAIPLTDGSKIVLNTATAVQTLISTERREVWLDRGEAYFEVAHKDGLPFVVHAGAQNITVLGTKFSVRRDGARVIVAVAEGKVKVDSADNPQATRSAIVTTGNVAIALETSTLVAQRTENEIERSLAWRDGMLNFSDARLADVASEFNRYNIRRLHIANGRAADIRIDGAFQASNVDAFVRLLRDAYGLKVRETPDGIEVSGM